MKLLHLAVSAPDIPPLSQLLPVRRETAGGAAVSCILNRERPPQARLLISLATISAGNACRCALHHVSLHANFSSCIHLDSPYIPVGGYK
jgi:hypothetical protein